MILYIENPGDSTKILLALISKFNKGGGYKVNIQKPVAFPYTHNKLSERQIKKIVPFTIASKNNKVSTNKINEGSERLVH